MSGTPQPPISYVSQNYPILPPATLPQNDNAATRVARLSEMAQALALNPLDTTRSGGLAILASNTTSALVQEHTGWVFRGTSAQQTQDKNAQFNFNTLLSDGLGNAGGTSVSKYSVFPATIAAVLPDYVARNPDLFSSNVFLNAFQNVQTFLSGFAYNPPTAATPYTYTHEVAGVDPFLALIPGVQPTTLNHINFTPNSQPYFPVFLTPQISTMMT